WAHIVAAIAWVGASFYFIALDRSLRPPAGEDRSQVGGEAWEIHGGGFYRVEKLRAAPATLPERLTWFKWEAYLTWLTGFALLVLLYYLQPATYLIDPAVQPLQAWQAIVASVALLGLGWIAYDQLARRLASRQRVLAVALCVFVAIVAWASAQLFSARASYIQVGAMLGTWMAANVFFVIIPGQRALVAAAARSRPGDPRQAAIGAQQLPHPADGLRDDQPALPVHVWQRSALARAPRAHGRGRDGAARAQPAARRAHPVGTRRRSLRDRRPRRRRSGTGTHRDGIPDRRRVPAGRGGRPGALRRVPLGRSPLPGLRRAATGGHVRHARADAGPLAAHVSDGRREQAHAPEQRHRHDPERARAPRALGAVGRADPVAVSRRSARDDRARCRRTRRCPPRAPRRATAAGAPAARERSRACSGRSRRRRSGSRSAARTRRSARRARGACARPRRRPVRRATGRRASPAPRRCADARP